MYNRIVFDWATPALQTGNKTVTRRDWKPEIVAKYKPGDIVVALDKNPEKGGKDIALIQLEKVYSEYSPDAPDDDYFSEGFAYLDLHPEMVESRIRPNQSLFEDNTLFKSWLNYKRTAKYMTVLRFMVIHVFYQEWLERASIYEFDAGMSREKAESLAFREYFNVK